MCSFLSAALRRRKPCVAIKEHARQHRSQVQLRALAVSEQPSHTLSALHHGSRAQPRVPGGRLETRSKGFRILFCVLGRPGALGLMAKLGARGSAPWKSHPRARAKEGGKS